MKPSTPWIIIATLLILIFGYFIFQAGHKFGQKELIQETTDTGRIYYYVEVEKDLGNNQTRTTIEKREALVDDLMQGGYDDALNEVAQNYVCQRRSG